MPGSKTEPLTETLGSQAVPALAEFGTLPPGLSYDSVRVLAPDRSTRTVPAGVGTMTIGRAPDNEVVLNDPKVSWKHASLAFDGARYTVSDWPSSNGTYLDGTRLLAGVSEEWSPDQALRAGDTWLHLWRVQPEEDAVAGGGGRQGEGRREGYSGQGFVGVFVEDMELEVEAGGVVALAATVQNQGHVTDHLSVTLEGVPAAWVPDLPPLIMLNPGNSAMVTLDIRPPRSSESRAGPCPLTLRARSQMVPDEVAEVRGKLTVAPYSEFNAALSPQQLAVGAPGQVLVENQGNARETFDLQWHDQANELRFEAPGGPLVVDAGARGAVEYRSRLNKRKWVGGRQMHHFTVDVRPGAGQAQVRSGQVLSWALFPPWAPPVAILLLVALFFVLPPLLKPAIKSVSLEPALPVAGDPLTVRWEVARADEVEFGASGLVLKRRTKEYRFAQGLSDAKQLEKLVARNRFGTVEATISIMLLTPTPTPTNTPTITPTPTNTPTPQTFDEYDLNPDTLATLQAGPPTLFIDGPVIGIDPVIGPFP